MELSVRNRVNNPERFIWMVLKRHFSFITPMLTPEDRENINQAGWVAALESDFNFRKSYNACQREMYALCKAKGFRRTRTNKWILKELEGINYEV